jgi:hypothetical protein
MVPLSLLTREPIVATRPPRPRISITALWQIGLDHPILIISKFCLMVMKGHVNLFDPYISGGLSGVIDRADTDVILDALGDPTRRQMFERRPKSRCVS